MVVLNRDVWAWKKISFFWVSYYLYYRLYLFWCLTRQVRVLSGIFWKILQEAYFSLIFRLGCAFCTTITRNFSNIAKALITLSCRGEYFSLPAGESLQQGCLLKRNSAGILRMDFLLFVLIFSAGRISGSQWYLLGWFICWSAWFRKYGRIGGKKLKNKIEYLIALMLTVKIIGFNCFRIGVWIYDVIMQSCSTANWAYRFQKYKRWSPADDGRSFCHI